MAEIQDEPEQTEDTVFGLPYWDDRDWPDGWDTLVLGEDIWPGSWEVSGPGVSRKIDVKKTKGEDGATMKDEGYQPARLTLTGTIWNQDQWNELQRLLPTIHPRKAGGSRTPLEIYHPQSSLLGITQIYIDKIGIPRKPTAGDGLLVLSMSALEWIPQPKPVKTGAGTSSGSSATDCPSCTEIDRGIANLRGMLDLALEAGDSAAAASLGDAINAEEAKKSQCRCRQGGGEAASAAGDEAATLEALQNELAKALLNGDAEAVEYYANLINQMNY
jgi:hypothetical protein